MEFYHSFHSKSIIKTFQINSIKMTWVRTMVAQNIVFFLTSNAFQYIIWLYCESTTVYVLSDYDNSPIYWNNCIVSAFFLLYWHKLNEYCFNDKFFMNESDLLVNWIACTFQITTHWIHQHGWAKNCSILLVELMIHELYLIYSQTLFSKEIPLALAFVSAKNVLFYMDYSRQNRYDWWTFKRVTAFQNHSTICRRIDSNTQIDWNLSSFVFKIGCCAFFRLFCEFKFNAQQHLRNHQLCFETINEMCDQSHVQKLGMSSFVPR